MLLEEAENIVGIKFLEMEWKTLGEISMICDGVHQTPRYINSGVPFISVENIKSLKSTNKFISKKDFDLYKIKPQKNDLFMTRIGDIGTCSIVEDDEDLAYYVTLALIRVDSNVIKSKYLKYLIESKYGKKELNKRILHNAIPIKINLGDIGKLKFLVPPLPIQQKIVSILDKFDALVNDGKQGLLKEIELRGKQYEYYREKLLDFKRLN